VRPALAVLSGVLLALVFPPFGLSLTSFVAFVPLLMALQLPGHPPTVPLRRAFGLGYLCGVVFFAVLLHWIPRLPKENLTIPWAMYPALLLMVGYLALFPALAAFASAFLARRGVPIGIAFALIWTLLEVVKGTGTLGFPWGSLGYAFAPVPHLIQFVAWTGLWGAVLWVTLVNGSVHLYLSAPAQRTKMVALSLLVALVVGPYWHGRIVLSGRPPARAMEVGIVQPNVGKDKWNPNVRETVISDLLAHTVQLVEENRGRRPLHLILWPETSFPGRLARDVRYLYRVESMVDTLGVPVLAGYPDGLVLPGGRIRYTNSAGLILPGSGLVSQYDKRHLVPFSERFPLPVLNRFDFGQADFSPGLESGVMTALDPPFGVLICFESIFPGPSRELVRGGARYLANITNDQWFGDSAAPEQHFQMNILRCIENRIGMVRAANTGVSAIIDSYGIVERRTPIFIRTHLVGEVELGERRTFYTRHGDWVVGLTAILLAGLAGAGWWRTR
jgi:apolipoprotein N-acyltransferase